MAEYGISVGTEPEITKSVEDFVSLGKGDDKTYANFSIMAEIVERDTSVKNVNKATKILYPEHNIIYDYLKELKSSTVTCELTDGEYLKYRYNPKLLAYDIYGSAELYFVILAINGMCSFKDFNKKKIKLLYKQDMTDFLTAIYNAESDYISKNRAKLQNNTSTT